MFKRPSAQILDKVVHLSGDCNSTNKIIPHNCRAVAMLVQGHVVASLTGWIRWEKPTTWRYKCNIDASFLSQQNYVRFKMCIRDGKYQVMLAKATWNSPIVMWIHG